MRTTIYWFKLSIACKYYNQIILKIGGKVYKNNNNNTKFKLNKIPEKFKSLLSLIKCIIFRTQV